MPLLVQNKFKITTKIDAQIENSIFEYKYVVFCEISIVYKYRFMHLFSNTKCIFKYIHVYLRWNDAQHIFRHIARNNIFFIIVGVYNGNSYEVGEEFSGDVTTNSTMKSCQRCTCKNEMEGGVICEDLTKACDLTCKVGYPPPPPTPQQTRVVHSIFWYWFISLIPELTVFPRYSHKLF